MEKLDIKKSIRFYRSDPEYWEQSVDEIYRLHLQSQIDLLTEFIEHPTKRGYKRHDVLDKIEELKQKLTTI